MFFIMDTNSLPFDVVVDLFKCQDVNDAFSDGKGAVVMSYVNSFMFFFQKKLKHWK